MRSLRENLKLRPCRIDRAMARSIRQAEVWDFPVTTERSRLLSCLLYGTSKKNKAGAAEVIITSGDARASLFIHRFKSQKSSELTRLSI